MPTWDHVGEVQDLLPVFSPAGQLPWAQHITLSQVFLIPPGSVSSDWTLHSSLSFCVCSARDKLESLLSLSAWEGVQDIDNLGKMHE